MIRPLRAFAAAVVYCVLASTVLRSLPRAAARGSSVAAVLLALLLAFPGSTAFAGEYKVATCRADRLNFSTRAFTEFLHRRMMVKRACNPSGRRKPGLTISNVVHAGRIKRGSIAQLTFSAPPGTRITSLKWAGVLRRRDCRYRASDVGGGPGRR